MGSVCAIAPSEDGLKSCEVVVDTKRLFDSAPKDEFLVEESDQDTDVPSPNSFHSEEADTDRQTSSTSTEQSSPEDATSMKRLLTSFITRSRSGVECEVSAKKGCTDWKKGWYCIDRSLQSITFHGEDNEMTVPLARIKRVRQVWDVAVGLDKDHQQRVIGLKYFTDSGVEDLFIMASSPEDCSRFVTCVELMGRYMRKDTCPSTRRREKRVSFNLSNLADQDDARDAV